MSLFICLLLEALWEQVKHPLWSSDRCVEFVEERQRDKVSRQALIIAGNLAAGGATLLRCTTEEQSKEMRRKVRDILCAYSSESVDDCMKRFKVSS